LRLALDEGIVVERCVEDFRIIAGDLFVDKEFFWIISWSPWTNEKGNKSRWVTAACK
jgi:hypothetical protein